MNKPTNRETILIILFIIITSIFLLMNYNLKKDNNILITNTENNEEKNLKIEQNNNLEDSTDSYNEAEKLNKNKDIFVDICGAVHYSQVLKLKEGDRVIDAVELAGGLTDKADIKRINLAKIVNDGEKIIIPEIGEKIDDEVFIESNADTRDSKIAINTASVDQLKNLNGIGEVLAERIIDYRNKNNGFKTLEEMKEISGIGEKKFEEIKDSIKLN